MLPPLSGAVRGVIAILLGVLSVFLPISGVVSAEVAQLIVVACAIGIAVLILPPILSHYFPRFSVKASPPPAWLAWRERREPKPQVRADDPEPTVFREPTINRGKHRAREACHPDGLNSSPADQFPKHLDAYCSLRAALIGRGRDLLGQLWELQIDATDADISRLEPAVTRWSGQVERYRQKWWGTSRVPPLPTSKRAKVPPYRRMKLVDRVHALLLWAESCGSDCDQSPNSPAISSQVQT